MLARCSLRRLGFAAALLLSVNCTGESKNGQYDATNSPHMGLTLGATERRDEECARRIENGSRQEARLLSQLCQVDGLTPAAQPRAALTVVSNQPMRPGRSSAAAAC